jgi:hypothetical protein
VVAKTSLRFIASKIALRVFCRAQSLGNLTPTDVYFKRGQTILLKRERIKRLTIETRRLLNRKAAA